MQDDFPFVFYEHASFFKCEHISEYYSVDLVTDFYARKQLLL